MYGITTGITTGSIVVVTKGLPKGKLYKVVGEAGKHYELSPFYPDEMRTSSVQFLEEKKNVEIVLKDQFSTKTPATDYKTNPKETPEREVIESLLRRYDVEESMLVYRPSEECPSCGHGDMSIRLIRYELGKTLEERTHCLILTQIRVTCDTCNGSFYRKPLDWRNKWEETRKYLVDRRDLYRLSDRLHSTSLYPSSSGISSINDSV